MVRKRTPREGCPYDFLPVGNAVPGVPSGAVRQRRARKPYRTAAFGVPYDGSTRVGATLAVVPGPDMHVGVGCRKGSPYAKNRCGPDTPGGVSLQILCRIFAEL